MSEEQIRKGIDEAFKAAGPNAYFGNGFRAGIKFVLSEILEAIPEVPKTFEWEGEIYTEGEWVAVRADVGPFRVLPLSSVNNLHEYPIKCSNGWVYTEMRKLPSFNQPEESSRKEKEDALTEYLHEEYDIVLGSQQISEIFHLIEKK
jgi:hypothetical protein